MHLQLEGREGDLPNHGIQHVLDLGGEHDPAPERIGFAREQCPESQHLTKDRRSLRQRQRCVGHQIPLPVRQQLMDTMAELMRQRHHVAHPALVINEEIGMGARHRRMGKSARRLARPHRRVDPPRGEKAPTDRRHLG